ncbi:MAG TPA: CHRD domain-containing protein [Caulobacteraceae bacterium]|jgi:hypothetical protein|nr:CHRD domain-containing protein [Caulobacteraceae bacterium]
MTIKAIAAAAGLALLTAGAAHASMFNVTTTLKGSDEVPPNTTTGKGTVSGTLDTSTKALTYTITYAGVTGPATAAHFHGPAAPGSNAPPVITMTSLTSPIRGSATLTDAQMNDLRNGKWYFNVHTAAHPGGEIRGQLNVAPK